MRKFITAVVAVAMLSVPLAGSAEAKDSSWGCGGACVVSTK